MIWERMRSKSGKRLATVALPSSALRQWCRDVRNPRRTKIFCDVGEQYGTPRCGHGLSSHPLVAGGTTPVYSPSLGEVSTGFWHAASDADHGWGGHHRGHLRRTLQCP